MNEIELIRAQLATERQHVGAVARACATTRSQAVDLRAAGLDYLSCVLGWFEARDQRLGELLRARPAVEEPFWHDLQTAQAQPGVSVAALGKLQATSSTVAWRAFASVIDTAWGPRRDALDALLTHLTRVADWRRIAGIDADSILEERRLFDAMAANAPTPESA